jgi:hypothetical protein
MQQQQLQTQTAMKRVSEGDSRGRGLFVEVAHCIVCLMFARCVCPSRLYGVSLVVVRRKHRDQCGGQQGGDSRAGEGQGCSHVQLAGSRWNTECLEWPAC